MLLEKIFKLSAHNTNVKKEVRAGITTFLAMAYIVPVNASIMSLTGMPFDALITATAVVTIIATILNGLWANTPIAMSVGMGLNAYFTFGLVKGMGIPWQSALGIVMISGLIFLILSFTKFRVWVLNSVPIDLRRAISAGIGLFIAFIGLQGMGFIVKNDATLVTLGDLSNIKVLLGIFGFFIAAYLYSKKVKGAFLISILLTSIIAWISGAYKLPQSIFSMPASLAPIAFKFDILSALKLSLIPVIITFLITDMFDTIGTLAGIGLRANLFKDDTKELQRTLEADAAATVIGASLGTSTTTSFIESAAGVEEGGRTGLTAVVCGLMFLTTLFFLPVFKAIPPSAIYAILVMVGVLMFSEIKNINFKDSVVLISAFLTIFLMPLTYSITLGLSAGFVAYFLLALIRGEKEKINFQIAILALIGLGGFIFH
ncbi:MAG: NCS2 family permease [Epsilonproteobacteria bacterium]|nr:NCS2 family permease [Campylobacterota bacterium]